MDQDSTIGRFMSKANPNEFAKSVLWHLAGLRAEVYQNQLLLIELLAHQTGQSAKAIRTRWKKETETLRDRLYSESLSRAKIDDSEEGQGPALKRQ